MQGILATGMPRSGTSWLGKMLEASGEVVYLNEPLNTRHAPGRLLRAPVEHRFQYINDDNGHIYLKPFQEILSLECHLGERLTGSRSFPDLLRAARDSGALLLGRLSGRRALMDDPFAVFSTEWFARRLGCQVVVIVRHPAAVIASRRQLGWRTDFTNLLGQPSLLRDWLDPFRSEMEAMVGADDALGEAALLWRMVYHAVDESRKRNPDLHVVRHEDLSVDPVNEFATLFEALGLRFTARSKSTIEQTTTGGAKEQGFTWSLSRDGVSRTSVRPLDSRANAFKWKSKLSAEEISRIRSLTRDIAPLYYTDEDWE